VLRFRFHFVTISCWVLVLVFFVNSNFSVFVLVIINENNTNPKHCYQSMVINFCDTFLFIRSEQAESKPITLTSALLKQYDFTSFIWQLVYRTIEGTRSFVKITLWMKSSVWLIARTLSAKLWQATLSLFSYFAIAWRFI